MSVRNDRLKAPKRRPLTAALLATIALSATLPAFAQDAVKDDAQPASGEKAKTLDKVVVTGSLIPQTELETFKPVTVITAEDISARGFTSVTEVLQKSTMSTGGVQGAQTSASFTQGAETVSLFGLPSGYIKFLIDGRPMANYPALYNGSDTFNNVSGIPVDLVDRIEILPGGQSSLYGSDAIAGVINIILKKKMDGPVLSIRGGGYSEGGGSNFRIGLADGFSAADGRFNALLGVQYEERDPIWAYQRDLTKQYNTKGTSAPLASRDYLIYSPFTSYNFLDPNNCANVTGQFGGTEGLQQRPGFGDEYYCGSLYTPGYRTLLNEKEGIQGYAHFTYDINDTTQIYGDVLLSKEKVKYHVGSGYTWWGTSVDFGYFYDPNLDDFLNLQRAFTPEDMGPGGYNNTMDENKSTSYAIDFGVKGTFGDSNWDYDFTLARTQYDLDEIGFVRWADKMDQYFIDHVLGPQQGLDPYYGAYPVFTPDYAAFYTTMSPEDFYSMTGHATSKSKTWDQFARAQVTNGALFSLPGGDAGVAFAIEAGKSSWEYNPYPGYMNGEVWGTTAVAGAGERTRYAATTELRLPVLEPLTLTASARYDSFKASGHTIDKPTWSLGIEYRPVESLLLRGKYGTAFRSPTLSDLYQGESGYYTFVVDYYNCNRLGFDPNDPAQIDECPSNYSSRQVFGQQAGNLELKPINADVWNAGLVWAPTTNLSVTADYYSWDIRDEVTQQSPNALMLQEYRCRAGIDDISSTLCVTTLAQITRNSQGNVTEIFTPKVNVSKQTEKSVNASVTYKFDAGFIGDFLLRGSYTENLEHKYQQYAEDPMINLLTNPYWSTDPKRKADVSLGWHKGSLTSTLYANWIDKTPNYIASISSNGYAANNAGKLPSFTTYNLSVTYNAFPGMDLSLMVNNLFNKMPPYDAGYPGSSGAPYNSYNFDVYGRAVYLEMRYAFGKHKE